MPILIRFGLTMLMLAVMLAGAPPADAAWNGRYSVFTRGSFSAQVTNYSCVGASIQMMLNMIRGERDKSSTRQLRYWRFARDHGRYLAPNKGADPRGWKLALRNWGAGDYRVNKAPTRQGALRAAAKRMRLTGKPVGMLVAHGGHAWVMTGFEATADPRRTNDFRVTKIQAMGPLWPDGTYNGREYDPGPREWVGRRELRRKFTRFNWPFDTVWDGYWVTINP